MNVQNRLEIDLLPPYGKPEVSMMGTVALYAGVIIAIGYLLNNVDWQ